MAMLVYCYGDYMMHNDKWVGMIPVLTSKAGSCLTTANWQEANIHLASYALESLLMKPGLELLNTLPDLATYVGWSGSLVLNASLAKRGADGYYTVRSDYDGRISRYSAEEIITLIGRLKPNMFILPMGVLEKNAELLQSLPETVFPFLPVSDLPEENNLTRPHGVYFTYDEKTSSPSVMLQTLGNYQGMKRYIAGDLNLPLMLELINIGVMFVESDIPAADAISGHVYCREGIISLEDSEFSMQFELIDSNCRCPTCSQKLTRAYLHHLLEHTPLLCQRYLVQHNAYYCQEVLDLSRNRQ